MIKLTPQEQGEKRKAGRITKAGSEQAYRNAQRLAGKKGGQKTKAKWLSLNALALDKNSTQSLSNK